MDLHEPVAILRYRHPIRARAVQQYLEANGIPCVLDGFDVAEPGRSVLPIHVFVPSADADRARQLMAAVAHWYGDEAG